MKILYVCRVFSGLETSLLQRLWQPTGVPTIYKMIEALDAGTHNVRLVATNAGVGPDFRAAWQERHDQEVWLSGLRHPLLVLAGEAGLPSWLGRLRGRLSWVRQLCRLALEFTRLKPDLVYVDRHNLVFGALVARLCRKPVLLRVMGVYPSMWETLSSSKLASIIDRWAYRSPFALVLCTEDGTGGTAWMQAALAPATPRKILLNGHAVTQLPSAADPTIGNLPADKMIALFVGRMEAIKGCKIFVDAMLRLPPSCKDRIHGVMIGTGSLLDDLKRQVAEAGRTDSITFIERLPHDQISFMHARADVYVSLNQLGQLSNANIEAMLNGVCMIIPHGEDGAKADEMTARLLPDDAVLRLPAGPPDAALAEAIMRLHDAPEERARLGARLKHVSQAMVPTWQQRVAEELSIIEQLAS